MTDSMTHLPPHRFASTVETMCDLIMLAKESFWRKKTADEIAAMKWLEKRNIENVGKELALFPAEPSDEPIYFEYIRYKATKTPVFLAFKRATDAEKQQMVQKVIERALRDCEAARALKEKLDAEV
jgi:hypothetical protein